MAADGLSSVIAALLGGTGVANSSTITLGGAISTANSFTTSGNFPLILTVTGSTNITLPTSGTLGTGTIGGSTGATNNAIIIANGTGGSTVQSSTATLSSGILNVADGAVGTPSLSFLNDPDCGWYRSGTNTFRGATNGQDVMSLGTVSVSISNRNFNTASGFTQSLSGGLIFTRTATAISYTTLATDYIIGVTSTAAARTITLLTPSGGGAQVYIIKDESQAAGTNNITVTPQGGKTIDGAASFVINTNGGACRTYYDGTNWETF
jgi:trimeric autotransporter adhesin